MEIGDIRQFLQANDATSASLEQLEALGAPEFEVTLPSAMSLPRVLLEVATPHEDIDELVALLPTPQRSPELWWLLERCTHALVREIGAINTSTQLPMLPEHLGPIHRYFYIYVFLAVLPHIRAFHRARGIPDDVAWLTLADLGRNIAVNRRRFGVGGLEVYYWIRLHFRGALYDLGRLQFERARLGNRLGQAVAAAGLPYGPGDPCLSVHVPAFSGPITPEACDASFARARAFFPQHFPEEQYAIAVCHSWLLDDQLQEYLAPDSNIIRFQRRFQSGYQPDNNDEDILVFVFGQRRPILDQLPQRTHLQRMIVGHLQAGRHWHGGAGWLRL